MRAPRWEGVIVREQASTRGVTLRDIVGSREFARGFDEVRNGVPFNADNDDWNYERGRCRVYCAADHVVAHRQTAESPGARTGGGGVRAKAAAMKKAGKTKAPVHRTPLDRLTTQLRTILYRQTTDVVLAGNLLIESRKHLDHGEWQPWLAENFDLSYRTALNYIDAAEYVAQKQKCNAVAHFASLAPSVLYE
jgi:Protein of unknown function (DUF3102)